MSIQTSANPLSITENAIAKIKNLKAKSGKENLNLRIYIVGGGCSGFKYGFAFDEKINDDDFIITHDSVNVVVDVISAPYLVNAVVDYTENLQGSHFTVQNPNAETTCGCGSSFSLKEDQLEA